MADIKSNIRRIEDVLASVRRRDDGRVAPPVILAAVKGQSREAISEAYAAGLRHFGENRVQEAASKGAEMKKTFPDSVLHLIGPLQTNKVREAVALFDVIQTLDRPKLAEALAKEMGRQGRWLPCLIQVNTGEEPQKAGVLAQEAAEFIAFCRALKLPVRGLMCIPPAQDNPAPHFAFLATLARRHGLEELSMGMSGDFEIAARFGATYVRIGTAIFGERLSA